MSLSVAVPTLDVRTRIPEEAIRGIVERIARQFKPDRIILFGSYARGEPHPESDIDLLVVMESPMREVQQALQIRQDLNPLFGLDILVYSPHKIQQRLSLGDSFLQEILAEGVVLYESSDA